MDESRIHDLAKRVGGRFRLASLVQKRLLELNRGQRRLVDDDSKYPLAVVLREIEEGQIDLAPAGEKPHDAAAALPKIEASLEVEA